MKRKNKRLAIGVIVLILLSSIIVTVGGDEDAGHSKHFTEEDCECDDLGMKQISAHAQWNEMFKAIFEDPTGYTEGYIGYEVWNYSIVPEKALTEFWERANRLQESFQNDKQKPHFEEEYHVVEATFEPPITSYIYGKSSIYWPNRPPRYKGSRIILYRCNYLITIWAKNFGSDQEIIQAFDTLEKCITTVLERRFREEEEDYCICPVLLEEAPVGEKVQLSVKRGSEEISNDKIKWKVAYHESINPNILPNKIEIGKVDRNGVFTAVNIGKCTVRATIGDRWVDKEIRVVCCEKEEKGNLDELFELYDLRFPESPYHKDLETGKVPEWCLALNAGSANNILSIANEKYRGHTCGGCQHKTLEFLHKIQADPEECRLLNGYEFGPIEGSFGTHHAVVVYPKGTDWKETGVVLDPWPTQMSLNSRYEINKWQEKFGGYGLYPVRGSTIEGYRGKYPTTKNPEDWGGLNVRRISVEIWNCTIGTLFCPADILITDNQGRRLGVLDDSSIVYEIPYSFVLKVPDDEEGYQWYFVLDPEASSTYNLEVRGTDDGTFELLISNVKDDNIQYYGEHPIKKGEKAELMIDANNPGRHLSLPDGTHVEPEILEFPEPPSDGFETSKIVLIAAIIAVIIIGALAAVPKMKKGKPIKIQRKGLRCPKCGAENKEDDLFCVNCGAKLQKEGFFCPNCGAENKEDSVFCIECGAKLDNQKV